MKKLVSSSTGATICMAKLGAEAESGVRVPLARLDHDLTKVTVQRAKLHWSEYLQGEWSTRESWRKWFRGLAP